MDTSVLKKPTFWVAIIVALSGIALSQGLVMDGSKPAQVIGWVMAVLGLLFGGKASVPQPEPEQPPTA